MLASRFYYVLLGLALGAALFMGYLATSMYNRAGSRAIEQALYSDSQVVSWYLRGDARQRAAQLIQFALDGKLAKALHASSASERAVPDKSREAVSKALREINNGVPKEFAFDAIFAVDQHGRVVAHLGYDQARGMEDFELGGYPVVADALHGYIRDDTLVLDRIYRVVARPVEYELGQLPAGAIVGARIIDDRFAIELSRRTGAAVAFFTPGKREASGVPEGFVAGQLDQIVTDLDSLEQDEEFKKKGRSGIRNLGGLLEVQYTRLPGEAWQLGAGFAVARLPTHVDSPLGFFFASDDTDKENSKIWLAVLVAFVAALLGIGLTLLEHTRPLHAFRREAALMAAGSSDQLAPSKFRGAYRKIASDLNDGIDKVAAKGGVPRRAADLNQVLGDIPDQPQMSAFSLPGDDSAISTNMASAPRSRPLPSAPGRSSPRPLPSVPGGAKPSPPSASRLDVEAPNAASAPMGAPAPAVAAPAADADEAAQWRVVFDEFVAMKQQCGEETSGFTYEKFEQTLLKNKKALLARHGAKRVKFSVYMKAGKAALKANPIRD